MSIWHEAYGCVPFTPEDRSQSWKWHHTWVDWVLVTDCKLFVKPVNQQCIIQTRSNMSTDKRWKAEWEIRNKYVRSANKHYILQFPQLLIHKAAILDFGVGVGEVRPTFGVGNFTTGEWNESADWELGTGKIQKIEFHHMARTNVNISVVCTLTLTATVSSWRLGRLWGELIHQKTWWIQNDDMIIRQRGMGPNINICDPHK